MTPTPILLDTDIDTDCDDAGALAVLHALADAGEAEIMGIVCNAPTPWGAPCIQAINHYYGRPALPVGTVRSGSGSQHRYALYLEHLRLHRGAIRPYNEAISRNFPRSGGAEERIEEGVSLYRRILAGQPEGSVVIAAIGLLTVLEGLLDSVPDEHSPLDGTALVRSRVRMLVTMGGGSFPRGRDSFNWWMDKAAAARVLNHWPTPLAVSEWGKTILTGATLSTATPETNPVRQAYDIYLGGPGRRRSSWHQVAVLYAIRGPGAHFTEIGGHRLHFSADTGEHQWVPADGSTHVYVQQNAPDEEIAAVIEKLMSRPPSHQ